MKSFRIALIAATFALAGGLATVASAEDAKPGTTVTKGVKAPKAAKVKTPAKPRTDASLACSKQADTKGLHGKARKTFMSGCKKAAAPKT